ncbi:hypothetical protein O181_045172 [Austropuccinia psidii MF-1]|uniref:Uncharacterized protein n=1 Tax=Austropuccinia psidii MF-1 TaxID=1389203 RepID=A0A9Q3DTB2_9BASI|nr:hypothetical protein [Austropuccinia psidii MF-1]
MGCGGYWRPPGPKLTPEPKFAGASGVPWDHKDSDLPKVAGEVLGGDFSPKETWTRHLKEFEGGPSLSYGPHFLEGIFFRLEVIKSKFLNLLLSYSLVMSSKMTELTESFPSAPPASVLHGSGIIS